MSRYVLDTIVLAIADQPSQAHCLAALSFLFSIERDHQLALDEPFGEIFKEYRSNLNNFGAVFKLLIKLSGRSDKVTFGRKSLPAEIRGLLDEPPGFDPSDLKFVEVAYHTKSSIVTEDRGPRDFDDRVSQILSDRLGIRVTDIATVNN